MSKKNSLTAFKKQPSILPTDTPENRSKDQSIPSKKRGPKGKPKSEKRSHRVLLSLTQAESEISKKKAGLAGEATAIYAFLKEHGYFS